MQRKVKNGRGANRLLASTGVAKMQRNVKMDGALWAEREPASCLDGRSENAKKR